MIVFIIIIISCGSVAVVVATTAGIFIYLKSADWLHWIEFTFGSGNTAPNPLYQALPANHANPMFGR